MVLQTISAGKSRKQEKCTVCLFILICVHMTTAAFPVHSNDTTVYLIKPTDALSCHDSTLKYKLCLTLEEYIKKESLDMASETTLILLPGTHIIDVSLNVKNVDSFIIKGDKTYSTNKSCIHCKGSAWIAFENIHYLQIKAISLHFCGSEESIYATNFMNVSSLEISGVVVQYSHQVAILIDNSNATLINLSLSSNYGTGLNIAHSVVDFVGNSSLSNNFDSSMMLKESKVYIHGELSFSNNKAKYGGAIYSYHSTLVSYSDTMLYFTNNSASRHGGAMYVVFSEVNINGNVHFINNYAGVAGGGIMQVRTHYWKAEQSADKGHFTRIDMIGNRQLCTAIVNGTLNLDGIFLFQNNHALWGGALYTSTMQSIQLRGNITFMDNSAERGGGIFAQCITNYILDGIFLFKNNTAKMGGGINMYNIISKHIKGNFQFLHNRGSSGGGIIYFYSGVMFDNQGEVLFLGNSAQIQGGGLFLHRSSFQVYSNDFKLSDNTAQVSGGALYMQASNITFNHIATFLNNSAMFGGGGYLTAPSYLFLNKTAKVLFLNNKATNQGGALVIHDEDYRVTCMVNALNYFDNACFYQPVDIHDKATYLYFYENTAELSGNILYGGTIDFCHDLTTPRHLKIRAISIFNSSNNRISDISSEPYKVCLCNLTGLADCSRTSKYISVFPGERFQVGVMTVGQWNGSVPSSVLAFPDSRTDATLGSLQTPQQTYSTCTNLNYIVSSSNNSVNISLKVGERCSATGPKLILHVTLMSCPEGFVISEKVRRCVCAERLRPYTNTCTIVDQNIHRVNNYFWVHYDTQLKGLILNPHCPFDYCKSPPINFTLQQSDEQCNYNRTGRLCGQCSHGLSLVLGTSKCKQCSNKFLSLLAVFTLAGLLLVTSVLVLRTTVAVGTFNGIIFYCNIIHINRTLFFPGGNATVFTIFISWMNIDLGIETCFYNGMDMYAKAWLQFVFPAYIWILCGTLILTSNRSMRLSRMLGTNPVAALATLFLASFTNILRSGKVVLSASSLHLPDDKKQIVWQNDANIQYLRGRHIPLFIVGASLPLLSVPYTILLLTSEVLRANANKRLLAWMNNPRVTYFTDAYNAPFKRGHAYWTGILLLARIILLFMSGINDPNVNLLATSLVTITLVTLEWVAMGPYKHRWLNILEAVSILNLSILTAGTFYLTRNHGTATLAHIHDHNQTVLSNTSVGVCMLLFTGILIYHTCLQVKGSVLWRSLKAQYGHIRLTSITNTPVAEGISNTTLQSSVSNSVPPDLQDNNLQQSLPTDCIQDQTDTSYNAVTSRIFRDNVIAIAASIESETMEGSGRQWSLVSEPHEVELREPLLEY